MKTKQDLRKSISLAFADYRNKHNMSREELALVIGTGPKIIQMFESEEGDYFIHEASQYLRRIGVDIASLGSIANVKQFKVFHTITQRGIYYITAADKNAAIDEFERMTTIGEICLDDEEIIFEDTDIAECVCDSVKTV